ELLDVKKIVSQLDPHAGQVGIAGQMNLGQTGHSRSYAQALGIGGQRSLQLRRKLRPFGPGTDQAHVATKHVKELRQLVEMRSAEKLTDRRDARNPRNRPAGAGKRLTIMDHGADLEDGEEPAVAADASLRVKRRAGRREAD